MKYSTEWFIERRFGKLVVLSLDRISNSGHRYFNCCCDCGITKSVRFDGLTSGNVLSCGCKHKEELSKRSQKNISNTKIGRWNVTDKKRPIKGRYEWLCICDCGKFDWKLTSELTRGKSKSCGCLHRDIKKQQWLKEGNPRYNPNLTNEQRFARENDKLESSWSYKVKQQYKFRCQKCGNRRNLNSHHIQNYKTYPTLRYDISNGICLCEICHIKFHKIYGKINNTLEQIQEFLECK